MKAGTNRSGGLMIHSVPVMTNKCKLRAKIRSSAAVNAGRIDTEELDLAGILQAMQS